MKLEAIDGLSERQMRAMLKSIFSTVREMAFCAGPRHELNVFLLETMHEAGVLEPPASLEHLMHDLGITKARAKSLMFDLQLRAARQDEEVEVLFEEAG
ncbi:MAG: hypothetical protein ACP5DX_01645 [Paracoccaceae bacterium]